MKQRSGTDNKLAIQGLLFLLIFMLASVFIYLPRKNKLTQLKKQLVDVQQQIKQIESIVAADASIEEGILQFEERSRRLDAQFPPKEEDGLRELSELARELDIAIIATKARPRAPFLDTNGEEIKIEGKMLQKVFVSIDMRGQYRDFIDYLSVLKEELPVYITVEGMRINHPEKSSPDLDISMDILLYLLS